MIFQKDCSNYSIKSKSLKWVAKSILPNKKKNKKNTIKNKTEKNWKKTWKNVLFWVERLRAEF